MLTRHEQRLIALFSHLGAFSAHIPTVWQQRVIRRTIQHLLLTPFLHIPPFSLPALPFHTPSRGAWESSPSPAAANRTWTPSRVSRDPTRPAITNSQWVPASGSRSRSSPTAPPPSRRVARTTPGPPGRSSPRRSSAWPRTRSPESAAWTA